MSDPNTSATGGPLAPGGELIFVGDGPITFEGQGPITFNGIGGPATLEDDALDDFFQRLVAGITGLAGEWVRPRWQEEPPNLPARNQNWVAIGVMDRWADAFAYIQHDPAGEGWDLVTRNEVLELRASFYGPNCQALGARLRDGFSVSQNREPLLLERMGLADIGRLTRVPEMIKNAWYKRADLPFSISRQTVRAFAVRNLVSAEVAVQGGPAPRTIIVNP